MVQELTKLTVNAFRKSNDLQIRVTKAYVREPGDKRIDRNPYNQLVTQKVTILSGHLQQKQCQLIFLMRKQVIHIDHVICIKSTGKFHHFHPYSVDKCFASSRIE